MEFGCDISQVAQLDALSETGIDDNCSKANSVFHQF